jgi:uncharacterized protein (TIRG00374 family)
MIRDRIRSHWRTLLALLGLALVIALVWRAGPADIANQLKQAGWGFGWLLLLAMAWRAIAGAGMWVLFERGSISLWTAFIIRTVGEAVNTVTPLMNFGGEPIKAALLKSHVGLETGASVVVLDKTMTYVASLFVMVTALVVGLFLLEGHPAVFGITVALIGMMASVVAYLAYRQARGDLLQLVTSLLKLIRVHPKPETLERVARIDALLSEFWRNRRAQLLASVAIHFVGRSLRAFDILLCMMLLGLAPDFAAAYFVAGVAMMVNTAFSFVPGQLGASEGSHAYVFALLGIGFAAGVSISLLRRARDWVLAAAILPIVALYPRKNAGVHRQP